MSSSLLRLCRPACPPTRLSPMPANPPLSQVKRTLVTFNKKKYFCRKLYAHLSGIKCSKIAWVKHFLKGQCHEIFDHFFCLNDLTCAPYKQAKTVSGTFSFSRRYSRKTCVSVVNDYANTFWKLWRFLADFKGTNNQSKKVTVFRCVYTPICNNLKIWKSPYLKKKLGVRVVFDYADTRFSNFAIGWLHDFTRHPPQGGEPLARVIAWFYLSLSPGWGTTSSGGNMILSVTIPRVGNHQLGW